MKGWPNLHVDICSNLTNFFVLMYRTKIPKTEMTARKQSEDLKKYLVDSFQSAT